MTLPTLFMFKLICYPKLFAFQFWNWYFPGSPVVKTTVPLQSAQVTPAYRCTDKKRKSGKNKF